MPTIDELFATMESDSMYKDVNDIIYIDPVTRQLHVPSTELVLGVKGDKKGERKYFSIPSVVGNDVAIAACSLKVHYTNANEEPGSFCVTDLKQDGDNIIFSWELSEKVTRHVGDVSFTICACREVDGQEANEWSTTTAVGKVLQGITPPEDIDEDSDTGGAGEPDIVLPPKHIVSAHADLSAITPADGELYVVEYDKMPYADADGNLVELEKSTYIFKIGDGVNNLADLKPINNIVPGIDGDGSVMLVIDTEIDEPYIDPNTQEVKFPRNTVLGKASAAFGRYLVVRGRESFAVNYSNTVDGKWSFAANQNNIVKETGENLFVAGGTNNKADGDQGAILGAGNKGNGYHYVILGESNTLGENASFVRLIGHCLTSNAYGQTVLGTYNKEDNDAAVIIACGDSASNLRNAIVVKKNGSIEIVGNITHSGSFNNNSTIKAQTLKASYAEISDLLTAAGIKTIGNNTVDEVTSIAVGADLVVKSRTAAAFGYKNKVLIPHGFAAGEENEVSGDNAYAAAAFGKGSKAHGLYCFVIGVHGVSNAPGSFVGGYSCNADENAIGSFVGGNKSSATAPFTLLYGIQLKTANSTDRGHSSVIFGKFNRVDEHALLTVGNGSSDEDRKNAFTVNDDNSITVGETKVTEEQLKKLLALIN